MVEKSWTLTFVHVSCFWHAWWFKLLRRYQSDCVGSCILCLCCLLFSFSTFVICMIGWILLMWLSLSAPWPQTTKLSSIYLNHVLGFLLLQVPFLAVEYISLLILDSRHYHKFFCFFKLKVEQLAFNKLVISGEKCSSMKSSLSFQDIFVNLFKWSNSKCKHCEDRLNLIFYLISCSLFQELLPLILWYISLEVVY